MAQEVRAQSADHPVARGLADMAQSWGRLAAELVPQVPELPALIQQAVASLEGKDITEEALVAAAREISSHVEDAGYSAEAAQLMRRMGRAMYELLLVIATQEELRAMGMLLAVAPHPPAAGPKPVPPGAAPLGGSADEPPVPAPGASGSRPPVPSPPAAGTADHRPPPQAAGPPAPAAPAAGPLNPTAPRQPPAAAPGPGNASAASTPPSPRAAAATSEGLRPSGTAAGPQVTPAAAPPTVAKAPSAPLAAGPASPAPAPALRDSVEAAAAPLLVVPPAPPSAPDQRPSAPPAAGPVPPAAPPAPRVDAPTSRPAPNAAPAAAVTPAPPPAPATFGISVDAHPSVPTPAPPRAAAEVSAGMPDSKPDPAPGRAPVPDPGGAVPLRAPEAPKADLWGFDPSEREPEPAPEMPDPGLALAVESTVAPSPPELAVEGPAPGSGVWNVRLSPRRARARDLKVEARRPELKPLVEEIVGQVHEQRRAVSDRGGARQAVHAAAEAVPPADLPLAAAQLDDLLQAGQLERATALILRVTEAFPGEGSAELACRAGEACRAAKQDDLAVLNLTTAVLAAPPFEQACWQLAGMALERKDPQLAPIWLEFVARLLRVRGADEDAVVVYRQLVNLCPRRQDVRAILSSASLTGTLPD